MITAIQQYKSLKDKMHIVWHIEISQEVFSIKSHGNAPLTCEVLHLSLHLQMNSYFVVVAVVVFCLFFPPNRK